MLKTRVSEMLGVAYPIVQGGLAHLAFAELAAAVSNAGALGQITAAALDSPDAFRDEVRRAKRLTDKPFGVNIVVGRRPLNEEIDVALEEGVRVFTITGGNPADYMRRMQAPGVRKLVLVAGTRAARKAEELGADAVIAVGYEGGGHIGRDDTSTLVLIPRVVDAVRIPVLASGGIADGRGLVAALALGAEGIEMGTRFVAVQECIAHQNYKEALVRAGETDTVIIERSVGRPGRALANPAAAHILKLEAEGATIEQLLPYVGGEANKLAARQGNLEEGFVWAGQGAGLIEDVPTVAALIARLVGEAGRIGQRLCPLL